MEIPLLKSGNPCSVESSGSSESKMHNYTEPAPTSESQLRASLVAQRVNNPPTMQETQVRSLGRKYPLEKEMATPSSILAWGIPWTEGSDTIEQLSMHAN